VHPNRAPAFNPPHKAGKHCSAFCSEEEGIPTSSSLFGNGAKNALMRGGGFSDLVASLKPRENTIP
jgi:hypothetical protein